MDVFEALYTTRAMRRVTEEPIPEEILKQMVDAAIRAPSGANNQGWKFIIVTESKIKNPTDPQIYKIEGLLHETLGNNKKAIQSWKNCLKYSKGEQKLIEESKNHLKNLLID